jgi:glyoxylase-like metal-dependent hydrolase (beta-lactamase superfamily II)
MTPRRPTGALFLSIALVSLVAAGAPGAVQASDPGGQPARPSPASTPLKYVNVADSVVMLQNEKPYGSNMTCFALAEGLVFVDAGLFTEIASRFRKDMEVRFHRKTIALLLTHAHTDHFFGMGAFADVPVVAAAAEKERFGQQMSIDFKSHVEAYKKIFPKFDEALETARPFMPTIWVESEIELGSGDGAVRFHRTGGHTSGSSYAWSESRHVIATGDNLQVDAFPYFGDPTTDMTAWIGALEQWEASGATTFCPGHGRPVDLPYLISTRVYFQALVSALAKLEAEGTPIAEAVTHPSLPAGYWGEGLPEPPWFRTAIAGLYRSLSR